MEPKVLPILITEDRMRHIRSKSNRGHITRQEIEEVAANPEMYKSNAKDQPADRKLIGKAQNGKKLIVYVKLLVDDERFNSKLITARPWS